MPYSREVTDQTLALAGAGMSDYEISRRTGISRGTVLRWRHGRLPVCARPSEPACVACAAPEHDFTALAGPAYAYLLGQYLGDGTIRRNRSSFALQIASDALYPGIIEECRDAIANVSGRPPRVALLHDKRMTRIVSYWKSWPCLLPQHGPGRKHSRTIALAPWQVTIVEDHPGRFVRGLIHSDGWRGLNRVRVKGRLYEYPRYQFSNRSDDIRTLFTYACELLGVEWRPWGRWHISVARRDSVALLDQFVGPKT